MKTLRAYKTELDPNDKQKAFLKQCTDVSRFVYNWALADHERRYAQKETTSKLAQKKAFNALKREQCPWVVVVPYAITEATFRNLDSAFTRYFKEKKDGTVVKRIADLKRSGKWEKHCSKRLRKGRKGFQLDPGYPQFKSRHKDKKSFQLTSTKVYSDCVRLTHIGLVKLKERDYIPTDAAKYGTYATVSEHAGRWFISVLVEEEIEQPEKSGKVIGVDFGIKSLAVCSNGKVFENPRHLKVAERKLKRLQRELERREKGSANRLKTKAKLQRAHFDLANARKHTLHEISSYLTYKLKPSVIVLEDLNVSGMMKNHCLAQAIGDVGWGELRRQVEYKAAWVGSEVMLADRWEPSSKRCSMCGAVKADLTLADREYHCDNCGGVIDRDENAALNLAALVSRQTDDACLGS